MKIAHVCLSLGKGGAEKLLVDSLPAYVANGHDMTIIQLSSILEEPGYIETVTAAGVKMITLSKGPFKNPVLIFKLMQTVKAGNYDILHVHLFPCLYYASVVSRLVRNFPPMVFTEHSNQNRRSEKPFLQPLENLMYARYDAIIAVSGNIAATLKKWIPKQQHKIKTITNGVAIDKFTNAKAYDAAYFENHFGLPPGAVKLCMASRFNYQKDQQTIIKALAFLPENIHVFFAGDGPELDRIIAETPREFAQRVHFLGFRADIPQLMKSADINILASLSEGFSGVTLEALASGKPFLGSDVAGINDVVPDKNFLFESQQPQALAAKITAILNDKARAETMAEKGLRHVAQFSMQTMIDKHIKLYMQLLADAS